MVTQPEPGIRNAIQLIPSGLFILTSAYHDARCGVLTRWVQPCAGTPPHVMVAVPRGNPVEPLIRDSRSFALCQVSACDRLLLRAFGRDRDIDDDPFVGLPAHCAPSGAPVIERALCYLDCELVRHVVLDADHRLYVGAVHHGQVLKLDSGPVIQLGGEIGRAELTGITPDDPSNGGLNGN